MMYSQILKTNIKRIVSKLIRRMILREFIFSLFDAVLVSYIFLL